MTQLAIAHAQRDDLIREAERRSLAAAVRGESPGLWDRITALLRGRKAAHRKAPRVAPVAK